MQFQIDPTSRLPIYRQLANQLREAVARGQLTPDARLPSVREAPWWSIRTRSHGSIPRSAAGS